MTVPRWLVAAALIGLLTGCGGAAPAPAAPTPAPPPATSAAPPSIAPGGNADQAVCTDHAMTANTVRGIAAALEKGPVLPAGVALFLLDARNRAAAAGVQDPALAAAQGELVAAIDDLDAQGRALLPAGGNPAQDRVQLDAARILAAVDAIERLCTA